MEDARPQEMAASAAAASAAAIGNVVSKGDCLVLLGYALGSAVVCELISWLLMYRRPEYSRAISNFLKSSKRLEKKKEEPAPPAGKGKAKDKKLIQLEREFEYANRDLIQLKSRGGILTALVHMLTFFALKTHYDGVVLARLPFAPFGPLQSMSHRNLPGVDIHDCGMVFLYVLCSMCIKPNLQKAHGMAPPKTAIPAGAQRLAERWSGVSE